MFQFTTEGRGLSIDNITIIQVKPPHHSYLLPTEQMKTSYASAPIKKSCSADWILDLNQSIF